MIFQTKLDTGSMTMRFLNFVTVSLKLIADEKIADTNTMRLNYTIAVIIDSYKQDLKDL